MCERRIGGSQFASTHSNSYGAIIDLFHNSHGTKQVATQSHQGHGEITLILDIGRDEAGFGLNLGLPGTKTDPPPDRERVNGRNEPDIPRFLGVMLFQCPQIQPTQTSLIHRPQPVNFVDIELPEITDAACRRLAHFEQDRVP